MPKSYADGTYRRVGIVSSRRHGADTAVVSDTQKAVTTYVVYTCGDYSFRE